MSMLDRLQERRARSGAKDLPEQRVPTATGPDEETVRLATKEFRRRRRRLARRGWRRRVLVAIVLLLVAALVAGGVWLMFFSQYVTVRVRPGDRQHLGQHRADRPRRRGARRDAAGAGRPRRDPAPGGDDPGRAYRRRVARLAAPRAHRDHRARPDRRDRPRQRAAGPRRRRRDVRQLRQAPPTVFRWCAPSPPPRRRRWPRAAR